MDEARTLENRTMEIDPVKSCFVKNSVFKFSPDKLDIGHLGPAQIGPIELCFLVDDLGEVAILQNSLAEVHIIQGCIDELSLIHVGANELYILQLRIAKIHFWHMSASKGCLLYSGSVHNNRSKSGFNEID